MGRLHPGLSFTTCVAAQRCNQSGHAELFENPPVKQYFDGAKSMLPKALRINPFVPAHTDAPPSDERPPLLSSSLFMIKSGVPVAIHPVVLTKQPSAAGRCPL